MSNNQNQRIKIRCAIIHEGKMLILRHDIDNVRVPHSWMLPVDSLSFGETLEDAAVRIAKEATGLDVKANRLLFATDFCPAKTEHIIVLTYVCTPLSAELVLNPKYDEYKWSNKSRLIVHLHSALANDFREYNILNTPELHVED